MQLEEKEIWAGKPSQYVNFNGYSVCVIIMLLYFPFDFFWHDPISQDIRRLEYAPIIYQSIVAALIILPILRAVYLWLSVFCRYYRLTTERLSESYGILNKVTEDLELYRVKDSTVVKPFTLRIFGLGNIVLMTSDQSSPIVVMEAIHDAESLQTILRKYVEIMRTQKGVREID